MQEALRVGVIGCGRAGEKHARAFARMPYIALSALCDSNAERLGALCQSLGATGYTDYSELLADPRIDAVSIALPDDSHRAVTLAALRSGKHILLEKPIASRLEDGRAIAEAARGYAATFMVGHLLRFDARHTLARDAVAAGEIGRIVHVAGRRNSTIAGARMYHSHHTDTSVHLMIHDIDYVNWIVDSPPLRVFAKGRQLLLQQWGMHDTIVATIEYSDGALAVLEACWILPESSPTGLDDRMQIVGEKGVIHIGSSDEGVRIFTDSGARFPDSIHWPEVNGSVGGSLFEELTSFVRCILRAEKPLVGPTEALRALEVVDGIQRSLSEHREVAIAGGD